MKVEIRVVEAAINGPEAILRNSFGEMTEKLPTTEMTDQRQPTDARSFFRNICGHTLPDFFAGHGRCLEAGEEIRAEKLKMFAIKGVELRFRHFCAEGQSQISERHLAAFPQRSIHEFAADFSDDKSAVEREKPDQAFAQTQSEVGTILPKTNRYFH